ncbi:MAG: hypothetical protein JJU20_00375 [Opitutales bacterium]|nr:hypothetical protein [Opitutales bacterium]
MKLDFKWHDANEGTHFEFGKNGSMIMDGTGTGIQCYRFLEEKINSVDDSIALDLRFVIKREYGIRLYNSSDQVVVECRIDREGWLEVLTESGVIQTGLYLTSGGHPIVDPRNRVHSDRWYARETDPITIEFHDFDFETGDFTLSVTQPSFRVDESGRHGGIGGLLRRSEIIESGMLNEHQDINKVELFSDSEYPGTILFLRRFQQKRENLIIYNEVFPVYWYRVPAPEIGYPRDNLAESTLRPVDNQWLEVTTWYGWVTAVIDPIDEGEIEFEMMASNVDVEAMIQLGSYQPERADLNSMEINVTILENDFKVSMSSNERDFVPVHNEVTDAEYYRRDFEKAPSWAVVEDIEIEDFQVYHVRIWWSNALKLARVWVDEKPVINHGSHEFSLSNRFNGVSAISLHPGWAGARTTLNEIEAGEERFVRAGYDEPQKSYWRNFRIKNYYTQRFLRAN